MLIVKERVLLAFCFEDSSPSLEAPLTGYLARAADGNDRALVKEGSHGEIGRRERERESGFHTAFIINLLTRITIIWKASSDLGLSH